MVGCDHHDRTNLLMTAVDREEPEKRSFPNTETGVEKMIAHLEQRQEETGAKVILFAYEASSLGFALYDQVTAAGIVCHVLAPSKMERSQKRRKNKTDAKDARDQLIALRSHVRDIVKRCGSGSQAATARGSSWVTISPSTKVAPASS